MVVNSASRARYEDDILYRYVTWLTRKSPTCVTEAVVYSICHERDEKTHAGHMYVR